MIDLHRKELEDFRAYSQTFLGNATGKYVLEDLVMSFHYNNIIIPADEFSVAILQGERNVIRHIISKMGYAEYAKAFVQALAISIPRAPEPYDQGKAETE